jgi:hypothetical protein
MRSCLECLTAVDSGNKQDHSSAVQTRVVIRAFSRFGSVGRERLVAYSFSFALRKPFPKSSVFCCSLSESLRASVDA